MDTFRTFLRFSLFVAVIGSISIARADSIVGYSGGSSDQPYISNSVGTPTPNYTSITTNALDARAAFLNEINNEYYYEDFQEITYTGGQTNVAFTSPYTFLWKAHNLLPADAPVGTLASSNTSDVNFQQGPIPGDRGAFNTYDTSSLGGAGSGDLAAALPGATLDDASNSYFSIGAPSTSEGNYNVTINIAPGANAVGLMFNDVLDPSNTAVTVTFGDGSKLESDTMAAFKPIKGVQMATTLSDNNVWFLGFIANPGTFITSVTLVEQTKADGIALDNIYAGNIAQTQQSPTVPLPTSALAGGALMAILIAGRLMCRYRQA